MLVPISSAAATDVAALLAGAGLATGQAVRATRAEQAAEEQLQVAQQQERLAKEQAELAQRQSRLAAERTELAQQQTRRAEEAAQREAELRTEAEAARKTLLAMRHVAHAHFDAGNYGEAVVRREEVLQRYHEKLGPEHANTLRATTDLAGACVT